MRVVCIGELVVDFIATEQGVLVEDAEQFSKCMGGSPANLVSGLMHHGIETLLVSRVGADAFGKYLLKQVEMCGINPTAIVVDRGHPTRCVFMSYDEAGHRSITIANRQSADQHITDEQLPTDWINSCEILHIGGVALLGATTANTVFQMVEEAHQRGCIISFDPNVRLRHLPAVIQERIKRLLRRVDLLKVNEEEWQVLKDWDLIQDTGGTGMLIVCTRGADGAKIYHNNMQFTIPCREIQVIDATGAGDAFWAGFLAVLLASNINKETVSQLTRPVLIEAGEHGTAWARIIIQQVGGVVRKDALS